LKAQDHQAILSVPLGERDWGDNLPHSLNLQLPFAIIICVAFLGFQASTDVLLGETRSNLLSDTTIKLDPDI